MRARSAAPITPASLSISATRNSGSGRDPRAGMFRTNDSWMGRTKRSPAAATPPPMTKTCGSRTASMLAAALPSQSAKVSRAARAPGSPATRSSFTASAGRTPDASFAAARASPVPGLSDSSSAKRKRARPEPYCSMQPRAPSIAPASTKGDRLLGSPMTSAGTPRASASSSAPTSTSPRTTPATSRRTPACAPPSPASRWRWTPAPR